jgi:DNA-binding NarL/FixJ family response regulator
MTRVRVLLADDHALVRAGFRALVEDIPGIEVIAETGDGEEALRLIAELKPDVAVVDVSMPGMSGIDVASRAREVCATTRVLILSMHADDEYVRRALVAGASGYLLKNADRKEMELAIRAVARGDTWLSPEVSTKVAAAYAGGARQSDGTPTQILTPRQREVLRLIAEGLSTKEIAARLAVSVKTVESHRAEVMDRLGIHGVAALVRYAVRAGIVSSGS